MSGTVRRVGVLAPMPSELGPVVKAMRLTRSAASEPAVHVGTVGAVDVIAMRTGMGLSLATRATTDLLDTYDVDHVLVVGIAGGIGDSRVGDVLRPTAVVDRIYMSCGVYEPLISPNRSMVPVFRQTGMTVRYAESRDGHNWENWRDRLGDGLSWLFPGPQKFVYE